MLGTAVRPSVDQPSTHTPRKLRDSCTDCASSKVRCSKDKPTCARCARRGVTCIYMVSRRTGRTSSNAAKGDTAQIWPSTNAVGVNAPVESARKSASTASIRSRMGGRRVGSSVNKSPTFNNVNDSTGTNLPSLRVGTPLPSQTTITTSNEAGQPTPGSMSEFGTSPGPDTDLWNSMISPNVLMAHSTGLSPPLTDIDTEIGNLFDMGFHSPMVLDCPEQPSNSSSSRSASRDDTTTSPDFFSDIPLSVSDPEFASSASAFDWVVASTNPSSNNNNSFSNKSRTCCFAVALDILTRLFPNAPSSCTLSGTEPSDTGTDAGPTQARTIDSVIAENKHTIESLTSLLDCPCSQDEYLISIMTLIALKVMGWYAAAAADESIPASSPSLITAQHQQQQSQQPPPPHLQHQPLPFPIPSWPSSTSTTTCISPTATSTTSTPPPPTATTDTRPATSSSSSTYNNGTSSPLAEQVLRAPATVGNYCVAGRHQGRMAAQLVLSELHRVQRLVNALAQRLEGVGMRTAGGRRGSDGSLGLGVGSGLGLGIAAGSGGGGGGDGGGARTPPFSVRTFGQLEEDLRNRMRVLASETIDVLRRA